MLLVLSECLRLKGLIVTALVRKLVIRLCEFLVNIALATEGGDDCRLVFQDFHASYFIVDICITSFVIVYPYTSTLDLLKLF